MARPPHAFRAACRKPVQVAALASAVLVAGLISCWWREPSKPFDRVEPADAHVPASSQAPASATAAPPLSRPYSPAYPALAAPDPATLAALPTHPDAAAIGSTAIPAEREVAVLAELLRYYRMTFGSYPTGEDNRQFMFALQGANSARMPIFPLQHPRLAPDGSLLDAWGSPFHFHRISQSSLQIRSAGPDRELFTADDIAHP